jgi:hypothetical protein
MAIEFHDRPGGSTQAFTTSSCPKAGCLCGNLTAPSQIVGTLNDLTGAPALPARPKQSDIAQPKATARLESAK